jgi:hypothetical protein
MSQFFGCCVWQVGRGSPGWAIILSMFNTGRYGDFADFWQSKG